MHAQVHFQEGLNLARQIGIPQITANGLYEYGNLYLDQQQLDGAEVTFSEMLTITPKGSQDLMALAQYGLARIAAARGDIYGARRCGEASITVLEAIGHRTAKEVRDWLGILKT
jgi:tetratricopeptide (TPR) repeat protein